MNLIKKSWSIEDADLFEEYLYSIKNTEQKIVWTKNILNTNYTVYGLPSSVIAKICNEIAKGNYESFLDLGHFASHEGLIIYCGLMNKITEFDKFIFYLNKYLKNIDSWAHTDSINFRKFEKNTEGLISLANALILSKLTFERRTALIILLKLAESKEICYKAYEFLNLLVDEKQYYVNMAGAWLLCELFIKHEKNTLEYFGEHNTNREIINKGIQKCRDSFRVSPDNKKNLLNFKMK